MQLYPHQQQVLNATKGMNRVAYYLDMGLGKTYVGSEKMKELGCWTNLLVCQKSKINDWMSHFKENYPNYYIYDLTKKKQLDEFGKEYSIGVTQPVIGIINYDLIFRRKELLNLRNFTLMLDESSLICNEQAKRSKFILKLKPESAILLSGTPTSGRYEKLWSQLKLLGWNISKDAFLNSYTTTEWIEDGFGYMHKVLTGYKNVNHLKKRLAQFGAVFMKTEEVIDLPDKIEQSIFVPITKEYTKFCKHSYIVINDKELIGDNTLTKILYQRMLCGTYSEDKLKALTDLVESTEDRLIVFYNFNTELEKMQNICKQLERPVSVVNGQIKDLSKYETCDDSVTFIQYQAGAYGLNLQKANKIIYFTLPLGKGSCDLWEQSKKRIHRIGQKNTCFYYYLLTKDSVEEWNMELLKEGKDLTDELFKEKYH